MNTMKKNLLILVILCCSSITKAQDTTFQVGVWGVWNAQDTIQFRNISWSRERSNLVNLNINSFEACVLPNNHKWLSHVADSISGMKMFIDCLPCASIEWDSMHIGCKFQEWSKLPSHQLPTGWRDSIRTWLNSIKTSYVDQHPGVGGITLAQEGCLSNSSYISPIADTLKQKWCRRDSLINFASAYWDTSVQSYPNLIGKSLFLINIQYWNKYEVSAESLISQLPRLGIMESDMYPFRDMASVGYSGAGYQDTLQARFIDGCDTCLSYFEKRSKIKWTANIQVTKEVGYNYDGTQYARFRWPTKEEVRLQAWLALSRGAKGIIHANYYSGLWRGGPGDTVQYFGPVDSTRYPRSKYTNIEPYISHNGTQYDDSADYRMYDWVKEINDTLQALGPKIMKLKCYQAFRKDCIPTDVCLKSITFDDSTNSTIRDQYYEAGLLKGKETANEDSTNYLILVNRHCLKSDTTWLKIRFNYPYPFKVKDLLSNNYMLGKLATGDTTRKFPSRDTTAYILVKLVPGGGRLMKIMPDTVSSNFIVSGSFSSTKDIYPFQEYYGTNFIISKNDTVKNAKYIKYSSEGYIQLDSNFTIELGGTFEASVVSSQSLWSLAQYYNPGNEPYNDGYCDKTTNVNSICSFKLYQNIPNPASQKTNINYQIFTPSQVTFAVYNVLGQLLKRYDIGFQSAGQYNVCYNTMNLKNGVYIYKLTVGNTSDIKKFIVVK